MKKLILCLTICLIIFSSFVNLNSLHIHIEQILVTFTDNILPFLLPFIFLVNFLLSTGCGELLSYVLQYISVPVLGVSGNASLAILCSIIGGYPSGAIVADYLYSQNRICIEEKQRIINYCSFVSPSFLFGSIGVFITDKFILNSMYLSILFSGLILIKICKTNSNFIIYPYKSFMEEYKKKIQSFNFTSFLQNVIFKSLKSVLTILGIILFFSIISFNLKCFLPKTISIFLCGIFEFSLPSIELVANGHNLWTLCYVVFILAWSGISVILQTLAFCKEKDFSTKSFILSKFVHATIACILFYLLCLLN